MIGIFGSAFNPPTRGHLDGIIQALETCEEVWLVPSIAHAFGKTMLPFKDRLAMVEAFAQDIPGDRVRVCDVELEIWDGHSPVYTIDVLHRVQSSHPDKRFAFLCGPDNILGLSRFNRADEIVSGWKVMSLTDRSGIRSTLVREARAAHQDIEPMVTSGVFQIIQGKKFYEQ